MNSESPRFMTRLARTVSGPGRGRLGGNPQSFPGLSGRIVWGGNGLREFSADSNSFVLDGSN
jgi:hypothetical protein